MLHHPGQMAKGRLGRGPAWHGVTREELMLHLASATFAPSAFHAEKVLQPCQGKGQASHHRGSLQALETTWRVGHLWDLSPKALDHIVSQKPQTAWRSSPLHRAALPPFPPTAAGGRAVHTMQHWSEGWKTLGYLQNSSKSTASCLLQKHGESVPSAAAGVVWLACSPFCHILSTDLQEASVETSLSR